MVLPSLLALGMPLFVGLLFGRYTLAGFLVGALLSAIMLAIYCGNAGGAMDNAKKYVEEGHFGGKGSRPTRPAWSPTPSGTPSRTPWGRASTS